jgi:hypothetical protein
MCETNISPHEQVQQLLLHIQEVVQQHQQSYCHNHSSTLYPIWNYFSLRKECTKVRCFFS